MSTPVTVTPMRGSGLPFYGVVIAARETLRLGLRHDPPVPDRTEFMEVHRGAYTLRGFSPSKACSSSIVQNDWDPAIGIYDAAL
jgi:hypothetical protein